MKKLLLLIVASCLIACTTAPQVPPTPFETGAIVTAPQGCLELRKTNSKAEC